MVHDKTTELTLLVTAIFNKIALYDIVELEEDDFYDTLSKMIFRCIKNLYKKNCEIDFNCIRIEAIELGFFERIGGDSFFADIVKLNSLINYKHAIDTIKNLSKKRQLVKLSKKILENVTLDSDETENIINNIYVTIQKINETTNDIESIENILNFDVSDFSIVGNYYKTGFDDLDKILIGFFKSELIIIGARPGVGKSALALNIALNIANNKNVLFFSLEMITKQILLRAVSSLSKINSDSIRRSNLDEKEFNLVFGAMEKLKKYNLFISDRVHSLDGIVSKIRKYHQTEKCDIVFIDYLQLIRVYSNQQRYVQVGEISRGLKLLANELNIPIVALAQLNRSADNAIPKLSDLRESGDIEQDADVIIFITKDGETGESTIGVVKNRSGKTGDFNLFFNKNILKFYCINEGLYE